MNLSPLGLAIIESFEELRLVAYQDQHGVWTIGWGHTGPTVHEGLTCSPAQADEWKTEDVRRAMIAVNIQTMGLQAASKLTQHQFDALTSFTYNAGVEAFEGSTLRGLLVSGNLVEAADEFPKWNHVNGVVNAGLTKRRTLERALYLDGMS